MQNLLLLGTLGTVLGTALHTALNTLSIQSTTDNVITDTGEVLGFLLPPMGKEQLFRTVMTDGVLPRKTFSMGEAQDKRYYLEARKIR